MRLSYKNFLSFLITLCALSLGMALVAEHFFNIKPCALCHYQRYIFLGTAAAGLAAIITKRTLVGIYFAATLLLTNAGVALYQVLVEQHILPAPESCRSSSINSHNFEQFSTQLLDQTFVPCDQVAWSLFGISFAGYNVMFCLGLFVLCVLGLKTKFITSHD